MKRLRDSQLSKRFFTSRLFLVGGFFVAIFLAFTYARAYYKDYKIKQEIMELKKEVSNLERKKLESLEILQYVMSSSYAEEKARVELNMKKPGENVVIINTDSLESKIASDAKEDSRQNLSNPIKWWYYFFHKASS